MKPSELSTITVRSDGGYFDALDGQDLKDGELLRVRFPDESEWLVKIRVIETLTDTASKEGPIRRTKAYAPEKYLGVDILIPLVGLQAGRWST